MNFWNQLPLFRLLIPLILGVLCSIFSSINKEIVLSVFVLFFLLFLLTIFFKKITNKYRNRWMFGFSVYLLLFAFAVLITANYPSIHKSYHFAQQHSDYCIVQLLEDAIENYNSAILNKDKKQRAYALYNLGNAYYKKGDLDTALSYYKKAARLGHQGCQDWLKRNGYDW